MIMPAAPKVGDVNPPRTSPASSGSRSRSRRSAGRSPGRAASSRARSLARSCTTTARSDKIFAPGYGEFFTEDASDVEALAVAAPTGRSRRAAARGAGPARERRRRRVPRGNGAALEERRCERRGRRRGLEGPTRLPSRHGSSGRRGARSRRSLVQSTRTGAPPPVTPRSTLQAALDPSSLRYRPLARDRPRAPRPVGAAGGRRRGRRRRPAAATGDVATLEWIRDASRARSSPPASRAWTRCSNGRASR